MLAARGGVGAAGGRVWATHKVGAAAALSRNVCGGAGLLAVGLQLDCCTSKAAAEDYCCTWQQICSGIVWLNQPSGVAGSYGRVGEVFTVG